MTCQAQSVRWIGVLAAIAMGASSASPASAQLDPALAMNKPDQFAWELFAQINQSAKDGTNNVLWETWADDLETFPPNPNPKVPPQWPGKTARQRSFRPSVQQQFRKGATMITHPKIPSSGGSEEVRRNKPSFDFIALNGLYYTQGLIKAFKDGKPIAFPIEAIEIKAQWRPIADTDKPRYHWNVDASDKLYGLKALHITSKILPNWFWATFEHVDNPNRGKNLGAKDSFGTVPLNSVAATVSPELKKLFLDASLGGEWQNYRLVAAQTDFTDSVGRPTLVGNSEIEAGFEKTSSCITCHARAAAKAGGQLLDVFKPNGDGFVGTPDPAWFFGANNTMSALQLDFVWGFAFAQPASSLPPSKHSDMVGDSEAAKYKPHFLPSRIQAKLFCETRHSLIVCRDRTIRRSTSRSLF